ncbi:MAG: Na+-dependent transporter [Candidatus Methanoplasma sp.]|jgi:BASS family bile acid:Na+ symporter|nr:Na+-dependent transporter [Candidatus Methanoplasma sp.]
MALAEVFANVRIWVALGIACGLIFGSLGPETPTMVIAVLMVQMVLSMDGVSFKRADLKGRGRDVAAAVLVCYAAGGGMCVLCGLLFLGDAPIWKGWALMAAMPCAVSSITISLFARGNLRLSILSMTAVYLLSLATAPLVTLALIGDAVSPLQIFKYVVLFIAVPLALNVPIGRANIDRRVKVSIINVMIFLLIMLSLGHNRGYVLSEPGAVLAMFALNIARIFGATLLMVRVFKKRGTDRSRGIIYVSMAVWRNSGLAMSLCMVLLADASEAVIPAMTAIVAEMIWFAVIIDYLNKRWPADGGPLPGSAPDPNGS